MNVRVRYLGQSKQAAGRGEEVLDLPAPATVADLLTTLAARHGPSLRHLLLTPEGRRQPTLLVFVGEEQAAEGHTLTERDEVTLLTPIAGGAGLSDEERATYEWQLWVPGFGEEGQERLKGASVLVSRVGGVGGAAALHLAMAGVGRLVLAHAGNVRPSDLNRQVLMTHAGIGQPRMDVAPRRLRDINPYLEVEAVAENVSEDNAERLVAGVDVVVSCAPRFPERLLLNRAAVARGVPLVDCATYGLETQVLTVLPGQTACLACLYPEPPPAWRREFPVFGAVAGTVGALGAMEAIKLLSGLGEPLAGRMLLGDLGEMRFRQVRVARRADCAVCGP